MKKVLINVEERELRIAILEDEQLVELYIESLDEKSILNNIYKGKVEDVLPGLKAAFVNVGLERNAFLHFDDVRPDLIWAKYREQHPELADEVPTAREALADTSSDEAQDDGDETGEKRGRRRGRRGGKKRRPDAEDSYSPGLPVGVSEDDLDDDDDDDTDSTPIAASGSDARSQAAPVAASAPPAVASTHPRPDSRTQAYSAPVETQSDSPTTSSASDEAESRRLSRADRQRLRRERWEQRKLERQQRRQQERGDGDAGPMAEEVAESDPGNQVRPVVHTPVTPTSYEEPVEEQISQVAYAYGTRGAVHAYEDHNVQITANQRRQFKARYGDNFGNIAPPKMRQHDSRENQADFFGAAAPSTNDEYSIWDERQPDLGPVPGLGKNFLGLGTANKRRPRNAGGNSRPQPSRPDQSQDRNKKQGGGKRRGGKRRTMRKRDNRSYFAFSADDADKEMSAEQNLAIPESTPEETAPKKPVRRRKVADADGDGETTPKKTTRKTAVKKPAAAATKRTKVAPKTDGQDEAPELPLDIAESVNPEAAAAAEAVPEKPKRTRKTTSTRTTRKKAAVDVEPTPDLVTPEQNALTESAAPETQSSPDQTQPSHAVDAAPAGAEAVDAAAQPAPADDATTDDAAVTPAEVSSVSENLAETTSASEPEQAAAESAETLSQQIDEVAPQVAEEQLGTAPQPAAASHDVQPAPTYDQRRSRDTDTSRRQSQQSSASAPSAAAQQRPVRGIDRSRLRKPQFQEVFRKGDEIMVQVVKEEIGMKGARISSYVSLPGRYLVLLPYPNQEGGISRKVEDIKERKRLKTLLRDISSDETAFIVRTAGLYQEEKEIRNDVEFLSHEWKNIAERYEQTEPTTLVYDDHEILYRLARDVFDDGISEILIDSHVESEKLKTILSKLIPGLVDKVKLYSGAENIFHKYGVTKQIQKAARRKVWLKSGGYLIIDEAEALTAIDVNTGKSVGKDNQEKLILRTNIEASRAVARELKLRDIGGLIVIDFIDMKDARNRDQVLTELKLQLRKDRSKTSVSAISEFGLVEMTRKRVRRSLRKTIFMDCPYCQGAGVVLNEQQIWLHMKHEIVRQLESSRPAPTLNITVNPKIRAYVDQNYRDVFRRLEQKYDTEIRITMSDIFHIENYQIEKLETTGVINGSATVPDR